ncbi:MAG TPA: VacB/RNase II family 3'-5' exoribonuclease [Candidatus Eisenbacteria bacterium]|nr:VacB/RNase II family 3'-5' exoribonuclease [Candidatus Eisenbacteria bacterium]
MRRSDTEPHSPDDLAPRLIGRALHARGRWTFDPARRWRGGRRELAWKGAHAPLDGDWCVAEVPDEGPAWLIEVLGADDRPEWDDPSVVSQHRLRHRFPNAVETAAAAARTPGPHDRTGREDLRGELVLTVDPEDARDHDDALSVRAAGHGRWEVGVHIADVSHYVRADSALDHEAQLRGTSCYLPGGVVPMLPEALSGDICSLRPDRDRLALSVFATLDRAGEVFAFRFAETVVRSRHRLHYGEVQEALDGHRRFAAPLQHALETLMMLARGLRARRFQRGALALDVPEVKAWVDADGHPVRIERRPHLESHELIEEFMLLANRCVGEEGERRGAGLLYRVHEPPSGRKLADLDTMLRALGLPRLGQPAEPAKALQALLQVSLDAAHRRLLHRLVLRSLPRARYLEHDIGHFGLATREYCHFTSPIRRYPDLHNHRRVREWVHGRPSLAWDPAQVAALAAQCSATEQNATDAEREAVKVKGLRVLEGRLGDEASGIITGLIPQGFFVELDDIPVDGLVRPSHTLDDRFDLDDSGVRMVGRRSRRRFVMGDAVRVTIARVDVPARECDLALVEPSRRGRRRHGRG